MNYDLCLISTKKWQSGISGTLSTACAQGTFKHLLKGCCWTANADTTALYDKETCRVKRDPAGKILLFDKEFIQVKKILFSKVHLESLWLLMRKKLMSCLLKNSMFARNQQKLYETGIKQEACAACHSLFLYTVNVMKALTYGYLPSEWRKMPWSRQKIKC